ncbi:MAG TPA: CHAT domain-containing protein [Solimonas sp.]|nr:CHAT domain-containing protein [Solimonas sp.]
MGSIIHSVKLEFVRSGVAHNQLLSPLTPYVGLCGAASPVTVHMPFEHRQILNRLARLRYSSEDLEIGASQRQSEVRETGELVGGIFGQVPALGNELCTALATQAHLVNLRVSVSANELGLIPFEMAIAPNGFPGSGSPLLMQSPIVITREIRRGQPLSVHWNRAPRILFAYASPADFAPVPALEHLDALREAIDPWIVSKNAAEEQIQEVKKLLTILPNATLEQVRDACRRDQYTHVHLLAHGVEFSSSGVERFGIALMKSSQDSAWEAIDGSCLAMALSGSSCGTDGHTPPTIVTLATCDSGNVGSVITPGGSIAHELHEKGIPWVIASQFPLWMKSSVLITRKLYLRLLEGIDPRCALRETRSDLYTSARNTHDWASLVCYATIATDLAEQVAAFRERQIRARLEASFDQLDELLRGETFDDTAEQVIEGIRELLRNWIDESKASGDRRSLAERLGMRAACQKRVGINYALMERKYSTLSEKADRPGKTGRTLDAKDAEVKAEKARERAITAYRESAKSYREALVAEPSNHWVATQYLSMRAIPQLSTTSSGGESERDFRDWWFAARQVARWQYDFGAGLEQVWAAGTLAELEMLRSIYEPEKAVNAEVAARIIELCRLIRQFANRDPFPAQSTRRQFERYFRYWSRPEWDELAELAVKALEEPPL